MASVQVLTPTGRHAILAMRSNRAHRLLSNAGNVPYMDTKTTAVRAKLETRLVPILVVSSGTVHVYRTYVTEAGYRAGEHRKIATRMAWGDKLVQPFFIYDPPEVLALLHVVGAVQPHINIFIQSVPWCCRAQMRDQDSEACERHMRAVLH